MAKITTSELEEMIRKKMQESGLSDKEITEELLENLSDKIKEAVNKDVKEKEEDIVLDVSPKTPTATPGEAPSPITQDVVEDPKSEELAKKEGELEEKEKEIQRRAATIDQKEIELGQREQQLRQKENEVAYKPELPKIFDKIGPEKIFIFDTDEISAGGEALSQTPFRLVSDPDVKRSMHDLWLEKGKKDADIFLVKFEKLGSINFDPFAGTSKYEEKKFEIDKPEKPTGQVEEMPQPPIDAIEPVKDVTQPLSNDMGLDAIDMEQMIKDKVEEILKNYFSPKN